MKYAFFLAVLLIAGTAFAACSYTDKGSCETSGCFWCYRCQGVEENTFHLDTCVDSNGQCNYGCSRVCGAECATNSDCGIWLNESDDMCHSNGQCSICNCTYSESFCPGNGTIKDGICYYGARDCGSTGCAMSHCVLKEGDICNPDTGCIYTGSMNNNYTEDYRCDGSKVMATQVFYTCNATNCLYSKSDAFIEDCPGGCDDGKCLDVLCNDYGIIFDCNRLDGYYDESHCIGSDIYRTYRDYKCVNNECTYTPNEVKQGVCQKCSEGKCTNETTIQVIYTNYTPPVQVPRNTTTAPVIPEMTSHLGGSAYNGFLFGSGDVIIETFRGESGMIEFSVDSTNNFGTLFVTSEGKTLYAGKPKAGRYNINFTNIGSSIKFSTTTSGWFFFAPAFYEIKQITVSY